MKWRLNSKVDFSLDFFTVLISLVSLIVSLVVAWSNRKSVDAEIQGFYEVVKKGNIFYKVEYDGELHQYEYGDTIVTTIVVVNPSPKDVAFFDLRGFYPETNQDVYLLTRRAMLEDARETTLWRYVNEVGENTDLKELIIPEKDYGVFKAGSFTKFDIIMLPSEEATKLNLSFKVAKRAIIKDQYALTSRKKFKFFERSYNIYNWKEKSSPRNAIK